MARSSKWSGIVYEEHVTRPQLMRGLVELATVAAVSPVHDRDVVTAQDRARRCARWVKGHGHWLADASGHAVDTPELAYRLMDGDGIGADLPDLGEHKKAHYHVLVRWTSPVTLDTHLARLSAVGIDMTVAQPVHSWDAALRYLAHLDSPEKAAYDPGAILTVGAPSVKALRDRSSAGLACVDAVGQILALRQPTVSGLIHVLVEAGDETLLRWVSGHIPLVQTIIG